MSAHLHVHSLEADLNDPTAALRLRADLRGALDQRLEAVLRRAGVEPEMDLAIRALDVEIDEDAVAARWAEAIYEGLVRALSAASARGPDGGADEAIALFPSRIASGRAALRAVARGGAVPWWWTSLMGAEEARLLAGPGGAERVVLAWIEREPAAAPAAVAALLAEGPSLLERFGADSGPRLTRALMDARSRRAAELGALPPEPDAEAERSAPSPREWPLALMRALPARELAALRLLDPACAAFFATCLALRAEPGLARPDRLGAALVAVLQPSQPLEAARLGGPTTARPLSRTDTARVETGPSAVSRSPEARPEAHLPSAGADVLVQRPSPADPGLALELAVGFGGLLFLLRWLARDPLLQGNFARTAPRLATFAALVLERVLAPLTPPERACVRSEHRLLLEVFVGTPRIEPDPADEEAAEAALVRLREALPRDLTPASGALAWTLRGHPDPLGAVATEDQALAILVLRPGRMRVAAHRAELRLSHRLIDPALRRGGWDLDPGWFFWVGRTIRFIYEEGA